MPTTKTCSSARLATTTSEDTGQHRAELPGHAVHEGQHLAASPRRQDAVEGSERGVRDAALRDLLEEAHEDGAGGPEADEPDAEAQEVDEREGQGHLATPKRA